MRFKCAVSTLLTFAFCSVSFAEVRLQHKVTDGATYKTELTSTIDQKLTIAGMDTQTNVETRTTSTSTAGNRDGLGMLRVKEKTDSLQINMTVQGLQYSFDSNNPDQKGTSPLEFVRDIHKSIAGSSTTIVYDKNNRVHAVEVDQNLLAGLPEQARDLVKDQVDPEQLKKNANQELDSLPSDPVNKGDTWTRTQNVNFGAGQVMTFQTEYTYQGEVEQNGKKLDKITSKVLSVSFNLENSPLPFKLKGSELKAAESEGTVLFDREQGITVESNSSMQITGDITFAINNMDLPSKLDLKMKVIAKKAK